MTFRAPGGPSDRLEVLSDELRESDEARTGGRGIRTEFFEGVLRPCSVQSGQVVRRPDVRGCESEEHGRAGRQAGGARRDPIDGPVKGHICLFKASVLEVRRGSWRACRTLRLVAVQGLLIQRTRISEVGRQERTVTPADPASRLHLVVDRVVKFDHVFKVSGVVESTVAAMVGVGKGDDAFGKDI